MATTLFRGGRVHSPVDPFATALVVDGGTVAWVGQDGAAEQHRDGVDEVVELDGAWLAPAFVDAHVHTTSTGLHLTGLDLSGTSSLAEALTALEAQARQVRGGVVLGHGWDETRWPEGRPPTREELDRASYGGVVYLSRVDVHSCVASSALLAIAPEAGAMDGFSPDGWLSRAAHHVVRRIALDSVSPEQRRRAQHTALQHAASLGIGMVHELGGPQISSPDDFTDLLTTVGPESGVEVVGYWGEGGGPDIALSLGARGAAGDHFVDGAIGSHTAFLREPYADADTRGACYTDAATIRDHVAACSQAGVQAGYHVIGDGAMDVVVAGFREAVAKVGADVVRRPRHRLEHVEMVDDDAIELLVDLGVTASVQPAFDALWGGPDGMYAKRLGPERAAGLNPFARMATSGLSLAFGSDAPVTPLAPWAAVRAAVHTHEPGAHWTPRGAFAAHTRGGWRAAGEESGGVLAPGLPANLAVWDAGELVVEAPDDRVAAWSTDPRSGIPGLPSVEPDAPTPACRRTVVRGRTVYSVDEGRTT